MLILHGIILYYEGSLILENGSFGSRYNGEVLDGDLFAKSAVKPIRRSNLEGLDHHCAPHDATWPIKVNRSHVTQSHAVPCLGRFAVRLRAQT